VTSKPPPIPAEQRGKGPTQPRTAEDPKTRQMQQMDKESPEDRGQAENTRINTGQQVRQPR
jgi:hypothetical protein